MRLPSPSRLFALLLISSHHNFGLAAPVPVYHDERDLSSAVGNLLDDFSDLVNDTASLLSQFVAVIKEVKNATNENDLVGLLGVNVTSSDKDDDDNNAAAGANGTVSAVAANGTVTCPDMAVLFARGTAELGKSTVSLSNQCSPARWRHLPSCSVTDEAPHQETSVYTPAHHSSQHYATTSTGHQRWPSRVSHTRPPSPAS